MSFQPSACAASGARRPSASGLPRGLLRTAMCGGAPDGRPVLAGPWSQRRPAPSGRQHAVHRCCPHGLRCRAAPHCAQHRARAVLRRERQLHAALRRATCSRRSSSPTCSSCAWAPLCAASSRRFGRRSWRSSSTGLMRRSALIRGSAYEVVARVVDRQVPLDLSNCDRVRSSSRAPGVISLGRLVETVLRRQRLRTPAPTSWPTRTT